MADIRVTGAVEEGPPGGGVTTNDEMRYRITIINNGPDTVPAGGISLVAFVAEAEGGQRASIEVSRFSADQLIPAQGGGCGIGRRGIIRCTNREAMEPERELELDIGHRHPVAEAGQLSFFLEVSPQGEAYVEAAPGNNSYSGPQYRFRNPPSTTTSTSPTTTTPTTTDPSSTSTTDPSSTSSSSSSTSSSSTTTTTAPTTTTTTTTTTSTTTTSTTTSSTIQALAATVSLLPSTSSSVLEVAGANQNEELSVVLGPEAPVDDGGPPYVLIGGLVALVLLLGGIGLAVYAYYDRDPPLVDIRDYHRP